MSHDSSAADISLADRLQAGSATLVAQSLEYFPHDAFWELRYAERGRRFAREDGEFHVRYLADAVRAASPTVMSEYAKWLRDLLVPRGMCSMHLAEHFEHLGKALERDADLSTALPYLQAGIAALHYGGTPAGLIQDQADAIDQEVRFSGAAIVTTVRNSAWETRYLCSYAADALARMDSQLIERHVRWARDLYVTQHANAAAFDRWVDATVASLSRLSLPAEFFSRRNPAL